MTSRARAVRNRLLVAVVAVLLAWLFGWTSDEGLVMLLVATVATVLALIRAWCGGVAVLLSWLFRYRRVDIGLRQLADIIGEHDDDMHRAGLVVPRGARRAPLISWRRPRRGVVARPLPDLVPRLRHRPYGGGVVVSLEAVRAGMSQDDLIRAVPRLRSAWGVDVVWAEARPGGRLVEFTIPLTDDARHALQAQSAEIDEQIDDLEPQSPSEPHMPRRTATGQVPSAPVPVTGRSDPQRPPDAPTVLVVQADGRRQAAQRERPPTIQPQLQPDERGRYELTMLPEDAASSYSPDRVDEPYDVERNPSTDEIPVIEPPRRLRPATPERPSSPHRAAGEVRNPTDIDERDLRLGPQWRTGKQR